MRDTVNKKAEIAIAAKAEEAVGLLLLVKPLFKRAGRLTKAEQQVLVDTIRQARELLGDTATIYYDALTEDTTNAVRLNGDR